MAFTEFQLRDSYTHVNSQILHYRQTSLKQVCLYRNLSFIVLDHIVWGHTSLSEMYLCLFIDLRILAEDDKDIPLASWSLCSIVEISWQRSKAGTNISPFPHWHFIHLKTSQAVMAGAFSSRVIQLRSHKRGQVVLVTKVWNFICSSGISGL